MITDKMLAQAAAELATAINESLPDPKDCTHEFSAEFERKMKRITRRFFIVHCEVLQVLFL